MLYAGAMRRRTSLRFPSEGGFSLIELLVVLAIIAIMSAVLLPRLSDYIRMYRIRAAMQQVASDISAARMRAISKNVNLGVLFAIVANDRYQIVIEDDLDPTAASPPYPTHWRTVAAESWTDLQSLPAQVGPVQFLPYRIQFDSPANCPAVPGGGTAPDTWGLRLGRLGGACGLNIASCGGVPSSTPALTNYIDVNGSQAAVCLWQPDTNMRRWVSINSGGRVQSQP